jgi:hypothetical protein
MQPAPLRRGVRRRDVGAIASPVPLVHQRKHRPRGATKAGRCKLNSVNLLLLDDALRRNERVLNVLNITNYRLRLVSTPLPLHISPGFQTCFLKLNLRRYTRAAVASQHHGQPPPGLGPPAPEPARVAGAAAGFRRRGGEEEIRGAAAARRAAAEESARAAPRQQQQPDEQGQL